MIRRSVEEESISNHDMEVDACFDQGSKGNDPRGGKLSYIIDGFGNG